MISYFKVKFNTFFYYITVLFVDMSTFLVYTQNSICITLGRLKYMFFKEDRKNYNKNNTSESSVLKARFFSSYKGVFVLKLPIGKNAASFGILMIGNKVTDINIVKHEYGHRLQLKKLGFFKYLVRIAVPSITANLLNKMKKLPYDYYGSPWESSADFLGGVIRKNGAVPWPEDAYKSYKDLLKLF